MTSRGMEFRGMEFSWIEFSHLDFNCVPHSLANILSQDTSPLQHTLLHQSIRELFYCHGLPDMQFDTCAASRIGVECGAIYVETSDLDQTPKLASRIPRVKLGSESQGSTLQRQIYAPEIMLPPELTSYTRRNSPIF